MDPKASLVLDLAARLLQTLGDGEVPPLRAVYGSLSELAHALGVDRVVVAIDHQQFGRQVFCSARQPLGAWRPGLSGPPGAWTRPQLRLDVGATAVLVDAVRTAFTRAVESGRSPVSDRATLAVTRRIPDLGQFMATVDTATACAARYGWRFSLALVGFDENREPGQAPIAPTLRAGLRAGDTVVELGGGRFGLLLQSARDDHVPGLLARMAQRGKLAPFSYGLVCCPGDGTEARALVARGIERLLGAKAETGFASADIRADGDVSRYRLASQEH